MQGFKFQLVERISSVILPYLDNERKEDVFESMFFILTNLCRSHSISIESCAEDLKRYSESVDEYISMCPCCRSKQDYEKCKISPLLNFDLNIQKERK